MFSAPWRGAVIELGPSKCRKGRRSRIGGKRRLVRTIDCTRQAAIERASPGHRGFHACRTGPRGNALEIRFGRSAQLGLKVPETRLLSLVGWRRRTFCAG